jgi:hypothetical protein
MNHDPLDPDCVCPDCIARIQALVPKIIKEIGKKKLKRLLTKE